MKICIIGIGGIGTILVDKISRFLNYSKIEVDELVLVDGDVFEIKNFERQEFQNIGPKARIKSEEIEKRFPNLNTKSINNHINKDNIESIILEDMIILMCVDNHKTRKIVSDYCRTLNNVTLISGGNDYTDGNVIIYVKRNGEEITPCVTKYHPEINEPDDKSPEEMSCQELANSEPQLFFTNLMAASFMCCAFYNIVIRKECKISEVYFDILTMKSDSKTRKP